MSRVQVKDLIRGFEDEFTIGGNGVYVYENLYNEKLKEISDIEIVPRKIVEDIIAECDKSINEYEGCEVCTFEHGVRDMAQTIKTIAESLLSKFEEEGE